MLTAKTVVKLLNSLATADPAAAHKLAEFRTPCFATVVEHPTITTGSDGNGLPVVGLLGVLNGIVALDPAAKGMRLAGVYDDTTEKLTGFKLVKDPGRG